MIGKHDRILWIIVGIEATILVSLITWTLVHPNKAGAPARHTTTNTTGTYKTPIITPALYAQGLQAPTTIVANGMLQDTRLFVTERGGTVRTVNRDGSVSAPVIDITSRVRAGGELGLLGMAFHPKYADNSYFYLYYTDLDKKTVVARYTMNKATTTASPATEKILFTVQQPYDNHNGGQLQFTSDGYLYIGLGDGGGSGDPENRAQDPHTPLGKILRIDVDSGDPYGIPTTNPFARSTDTKVKPEIWAYGLRNPWRFSFDSKTGDLYIADVGQGDYEEVNVQPANSTGGENYGWRCREGFHDFNTTNCKTTDRYTAPAFEYNHDTGRCSITGGYAYRGSAELALTGLYIYGDYCSGEIMYASKQGDTWKQTVGAKTSHYISTFGQDNAGELYYADVETGNIFRITDTAN